MPPLPAHRPASRRDRLAARAPAPACHCVWAVPQPIRWRSRGRRGWLLGRGCHGARGRGRRSAGVRWCAAGRFGSHSRWRPRLRRRGWRRREHVVGQWWLGWRSDRDRRAVGERGGRSDGQRQRRSTCWRRRWGRRRCRGRRLHVVATDRPDDLGSRRRQRSARGPNRLLVRRRRGPIVRQAGLQRREHLECRRPGGVPDPGFRAREACRIRPGCARRASEVGSAGGSVRSRVGGAPRGDRGRALGSCGSERRR